MLLGGRRQMDGQSRRIAAGGGDANESGWKKSVVFVPEIDCSSVKAESRIGDLGDFCRGICY